jgi:hypothetical protein
MRSIPTALVAVSICLSISALMIALSSTAVDRPPITTSSSASDHETRITRLEASVETMQSKASSAFEESRVSVEDPGDLERRLDTLEALVTRSGVPPAGVPDPLISADEIERTRRALAEVRREEMGTRITSWIDKERVKSEQLLAAVEDQMNLPWPEQQRVREIMTTEADSHAQILEEMWSAEPPTNRAEEEAMATDWDRATVRMKEIRRERDEQLQELLGKERFGELLDVVRAASRPAGEQKNR